jgi:hypothetical protein
MSGEDWQAPGEVILSAAHQEFSEGSLPLSSADDTPPDWGALLGIAATAGLNLALVTGGPTSTFIAGACLFWIVFVVARARQDENALRGWGLRADNLAATAAVSVAIFVVAASAFAVYASRHGPLQLPGHLLWVFILYPVWGLIQQFLMLSVVVGNLERVRVLNPRRGLIVLLGAGLFGLAHAYDLRLALGTFLFELVLVPLYLKYRNLWPLGVLHGWVGALFYLWILGRDLGMGNFR